MLLDGSDVINFSAIPDLDGAVNIDVSNQYSGLKRVELSSGTDVFFVGPYTGGSRQGCSVDVLHRENVRT